jgi:hypothetical protein
MNLEKRIQELERCLLGKDDEGITWEEFSYLYLKAYPEKRNDPRCDPVFMARIPESPPTPRLRRMAFEEERAKRKASQARASAQTDSGEQVK